MSAGGWAVCVFCAASATDPALLALAREVGLGVAARGWTLVSGGGNVSMMGGVARAAREGGATTLGVIPTRLADREVADVDSGELVVVETMRERKRVMDERSDAVLVLPGGLGTLEELFEMWTSAVLGFHDKPVVICDPGGHYTPLLDWIGTLVTSGMVDPVALELIRVFTDVEHALDACTPGVRR